MGMMMVGWGDTEMVRLSCLEYCQRKRVSLRMGVKYIACGVRKGMGYSPLHSTQLNSTQFKTFSNSSIERKKGVRKGFLLYSISTTGKAQLIHSDHLYSTAVKLDSVPNGQPHPYHKLVTTTFGL